MRERARAKRPRLSGAERGASAQAARSEALPPEQSRARRFRPSGAQRSAPALAKVGGRAMPHKRRGACHNSTWRAGGGAFEPTDPCASALESNASAQAPSSRACRCERTRAKRSCPSGADRSTPVRVGARERAMSRKRRGACHRSTWRSGGCFRADRPGASAIEPSAQARAHVSRAIERERARARLCQQRWMTAKMMD